MAPLFLGHGQDIINKIRKQKIVEEYLANQGSSTTASPAIDMEDESSLAIDNSVTNESSDVALDQSNMGFSFVNIHWALFSTGLSSVLAVILAGLYIAGCCYFRGRRQRQSCARHSELLHALSSSARHVSSNSRQQSGTYPGSSTSTSLPSQDAVGAPTYPVAR